MLFNTQHVTECPKIADLANLVLGFLCFFFGSNDSSEAAIKFPSLITRSLIPNMSLLAQNWPIWVILGGLGF